MHVRPRKPFPQMVVALLLISAFISVQNLPAQPPAGIISQPAQVRIDVANVKHWMAGGAGASWHAIGPTAFWYQDLNRANRNSRGSGWGGNPPLQSTEAWSDLTRLARWLGMDFIRVEIDMRMYEPRRGEYDWQNTEMQTLYRILDYCQRNNVDVFLTEMWQDVDWNAFEKAGRLQSAPKSVPDFAQGLGTLLDYLVKTRHYTCIRWLVLTNEPGESWGWWLGADGKPAGLMPALHAVRAELDKRGIDVGLSGPDRSSMAQDPSDFDFNDKAVAAHDAHNYSYSAATGLQKLWVDRAHARGIPFFQSEIGTWAGDDPFSHPTTPSPKNYANQLINAEKVIRGLNVGVDGFNRWSFVNRGDLDGEWQLVRTFDTTTWNYFEHATPEPVPYFTYGILTRFMAKHSGILATETSKSDLAVAALRSPKGNLSIYLLNKSDSDAGVHLALDNSSEQRNLYKYQVTESAVNKADFEMNPLGVFQISGQKPAVEDSLPPMSITVYTTYKLMNSDLGITTD